MRQILVVDDYLFGHKNLNLQFLRLLSKTNKLLILDHENYYSDLKSVENIELISFKAKMPDYRHKPLKLFSATINAFIIATITKNIKFDTVLFLHYNLLILPLFLFLLKGDFYVMDHSTCDDLNSNIMIKAFEYTKNRVNHLVLSDFIKNIMIRDYGVSVDKINTIDFPLPNDFSVSMINNLEYSNLVVLSTGNESDETLISELINLEKEESFFARNNIHLIIRSSYQVYSDEYVKVFTGILSRSEYVSLYNSATVVLLLYKKTYRCRFSASAIDALCNKKKVFGTAIPFMDYYHKMYPNNCKVFTNVKELIFQLQNSINDFDMKEYNNFLDYHSLKKIKKQIEDVFYKE